MSSSTKPPKEDDGKTAVATPRTRRDEAPENTELRTLRTVSELADAGDDEIDSFDDAVTEEAAMLRPPVASAGEDDEVTIEPPMNAVSPPWKEDAADRVDFDEPTLPQAPPRAPHDRS